MKTAALLLVLISGLSAPSAAPQATSAAAASTAREKVSKTQFDELFKQVSNWGRWGKTDQLGTMNLITPAKRKAAAALATAGIPVSLARDINQEKSVDNPTPFQDVMNLGVDGKFNMDTYTVNFHGFAFSHFDALSHTYYEGKLYNGFPDTSVTARGAEYLDTAQYKNGIFTRGVLVDIPWLRGKPYLDKTDYINAHDLEAWEAKTGVHIGPGDAVVIRTGRWALRDSKGPWDISSASAGLDPSVMLWLHKRDAAVLVSDAAHDAIPSAVESVDFPIHVLGIVAMGMAFADQCNLEDVAREAVTLHRQTFLFTMSPIRIVGGTGALINPTAIF